MKKIFFLVAASALLFACNQDEKNAANGKHASHEHAVANEQLTLNNGAKWKADSITNNNVVFLKTISDNFRIKPFPSTSDYQLLGSDLSAGVNKLIHDCKMSGPDHDALHKWLEPVIKESNQLKTITDTSVARATFKAIDERIANYRNYFE